MWRRITYLCLLSLLFHTGCIGIRPPQEVGSPVLRPMVVTGYCHCGSCCGWRRNWYGRAVFAAGPMKGQPKRVGQAASGTMVRRGTIAADTSRYPFGTIMYIEGYGYGRVEDRGGAIRGERLDLYFRTHGEALRWGRQRRMVKVWLPYAPAVKKPGSPGTVGRGSPAPAAPATSNNAPRTSNVGVRTPASPATGR